MRTSAKIVTALSVTGLALAAGSAFTGAGLVNAAGSSQFVGGTVTQSVTGATLTNLEYGFTNATNSDAVNKVTLTFAPGATGKAVNISLAGGTPADFTCTDIDVDGLSICDPTVPGTSQSGVTNASVTVTDAV
ncbi:hypothetical protein [Pseudarthrobacter sp. W1I19]|uniref:hypothetical protein n=1 Tax=Pseudarthrobacter sp. W1I19 TaxID=3042288 RepID=UPI0027D8DA1C|nr:hypothetical protein [Pseudarthrobacter sp. W1I19]